MEHKWSRVAALSSIIALFIGVAPSLVAFGIITNKVTVNETYNEAQDARIEKLEDSVTALRELTAAQQELNKLLHRYFEQKTE